MAKRKKVVEPELYSDDDEQEPYVEEEGGLTFKMRYTVGVLKPSQSYEGTKCFGMFFETEKLSEAKEEAEKAFKEDNLEVAIWDSTKVNDEDVIRYIPESEIKDDDDEPVKPKRKPVKKKANRSESSLSGSGVSRKKKIPPSKRKKSVKRK